MGDARSSGGRVSLGGDRAGATDAHSSSVTGSGRGARRRGNPAGPLSAGGFCCPSLVHQEPIEDVWGLVV